MSEPPRPDARAALSAERLRAHRLVDDLRADLASLFAATADANGDDEHDPEGSTIAFERSQLSVSIDAAQVRLADVDAALQRVDRATYGICEQCGSVISAQRLAARPAAERCINCAR